MAGVASPLLLETGVLRWVTLAALVTASAQLVRMRTGTGLAFSFAPAGSPLPLHKMFSIFARATLRYPRHSGWASSEDVHLFLVCFVTTFSFVTVYLG